MPEIAILVLSQFHTFQRVTSTKSLQHVCSIEYWVRKLFSLSDTFYGIKHTAEIKVKAVLNDNQDGC